MLDINLIRKNPQLIKSEIKKRNLKINLDVFLEIDRKRRKILSKIEELRAQKNKKTDVIAKLSGQDKQSAILEVKALNQRIRELEPKFKKLDQEFNKQLLGLPNITKPDVKIGRDERDNEIIKKWGGPRQFNFKVKDHLEIGESLDIIDVKRAAKVSGSRFYYLKNEAVQLEFAIINFVLDFLTDPENLVKIAKKNKLVKPKKEEYFTKTFIPITPPYMISDKSMQGMGYLAHGGEEDTYHFIKDKLYLIGTAEHALGPMHMEETFTENDLPIRYLGFSSCFRREAGSWGKDTRGILRTHQFDKLEMFSFVRPQNSDNEHNFFLSLAEGFVQALGIPYRVVKICTGDLGYPSARTYDIECWIPSQNCYRETHSTSTCTDYQARRLNIRYKSSKEGKTNIEFVHTINGTAFAIGRILIAILENYQEKDGSVKIPKVLQKYTKFNWIKKDKLV